MKLLARQEEHASQDLSISSSVSESLVRLSDLLRQFLRSMGGEEPSSSSMAAPAAKNEDGDFRDAWTLQGPVADQAMEREIELARLEEENEELKRLLGLGAAASSSKFKTDSRPTPFDATRLGLDQSRPASAAKIGTLGPSFSLFTGRSPG
jgi:hypothetical protein